MYFNNLLALFFELQIYCFYSDLKTFDPLFSKKVMFFIEIAQKTVLKTN